jgi:site-specific recombinase XerD
LEHKPALLINNDLIVDFLKDLFENKALARKSIEKYQQILFSFFNYLIDKKKINMHNPVLNISRIGIIKDEAAAAIPAR